MMHKEIRMIEGSAIKLVENKYPLLMINHDEDLIVMCTEKPVDANHVFTGVSVVSKDGVGNYSEYWVRASFTPYTGEVTLKNK